MADQQILRIERLTAQLGIEVGAAILEAAAGQYVVIGKRHFRHVVRELVGIPAGLVIVAVHVDGAEDAEGVGHCQLMLEGMAGEDGVALLDIDLHFLIETVLLQEGINGRDVVVVLVLGRLLRLRLDQDRAFKTDLVLVFHHQIEEAAELVELTRKIGVEQGLVTFTTAPENIVRAAELLGGVHAGLHGCGGEGEDIRIGIGGGAGHETAI
ncbi:hypothetical protein D3C78_1245840 [compost metagenome]